CVGRNYHGHIVTHTAPALKSAAPGGNPREVFTWLRGVAFRYGLRCHRTAQDAHHSLKHIPCQGGNRPSTLLYVVLYHTIRSLRRTLRGAAGRTAPADVTKLFDR